MPRRLRMLAAASALFLLAACRVTSGALGATFVADSLPADANGPRLRYHVVGKGADTVLVVAGGSAIDGRYLAPVTRDLAASGVVIFLEGRGRGPDSLPVDQMGFEADAADIERMRQHLQLKRVRLLAHAHGARVAMRWAMRHHEAAERIVLLGPTAVTPGHVYAITAEAQDTAWVRTYVAATGEPARRATPRKWCEQWWPGEFLPLPVSMEIRRDPALARAICTADSTALARRFDVSNAALAGVGQWAWPDSTAPRPLNVLVVTGDSLPTPGSLLAGHLWHSALIWAAGTDSGRVWSLQGDPVFPQHGRISTMSKAVASYLRDGRWPAGARRPRDQDADRYNDWVGRERRTGVM